MNLVILSGRLTRDPETRYTNSNTPVCSFSLAVADGKTKDGDQKTQFINCVAWEKTAEFVQKHFAKGDGVTVTGKLTSRSYEKDGQKRTVYEVMVNNVEFPLSRKERYGTEAAKPGAFTDIDDDEELPF